ncbi:MAG: hypothetical protein WHT07_00120 [Desulfobaccales bacterium]
MPPNQQLIALIAALPQEVGPLLRRLRARHLQGFPFPAWKFHSATSRGLVAVAGMGGAAALKVAEKLLEQSLPAALLSIGFAGALTPDLRVGDLVVGEAFYRVEHSGKLAEVPAPPAFRALEPLLASLHTAKLTAWKGACLAPPALMPKQLLRTCAAALPCPIVDLESTALAELAAVRRLHFLALRAISDAAHQEMPPFIAQAVAASRIPTFRDAARWLREDPQRLPVLVRLWHQSFRAARSLARGLAVVLEKAGA